MRISVSYNSLGCENIALFPGSPSSVNAHNITFDAVKIAEGEPERFWHVNVTSG